MKVGVVLDEYVPQDGGGFTMQAEVLRAIGALAAESNHDFTIICKSEKKSESVLAGNHLKRIEYGAPGFVGRARGFLARRSPGIRGHWRWHSGLERAAREKGIEFLWFLGQRPQNVDLPYMAIVFDLQHRLQPWFPEVSEFGQWETRESGFARHLRRAVAIITGTNAGKTEIANFFQVPPERIRILPHPTPEYALNAKKSDPKSLGSFGLSGQYLFYPAQFWAHKNHVNLLYALKILSDKGKKFTLALAGSDFGNRGFVEARVKDLSLAGQVKFVDFVSQDQLIALYQHAFALVYTSYFGPENLPPLEAFALGCPVVAARVDGADEQLGDAAILINPSKPEEIASAILDLEGDENRRAQLILKGRARAESWTANDFALGAFKVLDEFSSVRRTWN